MEEEPFPGAGTAPITSADVNTMEQNESITQRQTATNAGDRPIAANDENEAEMQSTMGEEPNADAGGALATTTADAGNKTTIATADANTEKNQNEDWKLLRRTYVLPKKTKASEAKTRAQKAVDQTPQGPDDKRVFTKRKFPSTVRRKAAVSSSIPKSKGKAAAASTPRTPSNKLDSTQVIGEGTNYVRSRPINSVTLSRINRTIRPEEDDWADLQTPEQLKGPGPFYIQRTESDFMNHPRTQKTSKMRWTTENDMMLLLFGLGRDISGEECKHIANWFPEKPTQKAITERLTKLRAKTRQVLKESGIHVPKPSDTPSKSSLNVARTPSTKNDQPSSQQRPAKRLRTSAAQVDDSSPTPATAAPSTGGRKNTPGVALVSSAASAPAQQTLAPAEQSLQAGTPAPLTQQAMVPSMRTQHIQQTQMQWVQQMQQQQQQHRVPGQNQLGAPSLVARAPTPTIQTYQQHQQGNAPLNPQNAYDGRLSHPALNSGSVHPEQQGQMQGNQQMLEQFQRQQMQRQQQRPPAFDPQSATAQPLALMPAGTYAGNLQYQQYLIPQYYGRPPNVGPGPMYQGQENVYGHQQQQQQQLAINQASGANPGIASSPPSTGDTPARQQAAFDQATVLPSSPPDDPTISPGLSTASVQPTGFPYYGAPLNFTNEFQSPVPGPAYPAMAAYQPFQQQGPSIMYQQQYQPFPGMIPPQQGFRGSDVQPGNIQDEATRAHEMEGSEGHGVEEELEQ